MLGQIGKDTGLDYKVIDLRKLNIQPCTGCVKCGTTNRCVQKDDMAPLYDEIQNADALVIGGVTYFAHPNALTRTFMERMYPLRHRKPQTLDMPGGAVAVGGEEAEQTAQEIAYHMQGYFNFNMVGSVAFKSATWPCFVCGHGLTCKFGGPSLFYGEKWFDTKEITQEMFKNFEDDPVTVGACKGLSEALKTAIETGGAKRG
jgi:hypothetical protein